MKRKNWMDALRVFLSANLSFWVDDEKNPVIQKWFAENYRVLKDRGLV